MRKCLLFAVCFVSAAYLSFPAQAAEESVNVISCAGEVKLIPSTGMEAVVCRGGMRLEEGSRIITGKGSYVEIAFDRTGRNIVKIKENSEVVVKLDGSEKIELIDGEILAMLRKLKRREAFRVRTPCATCGARGTDWSTKTDGKVTDIAVLSGKVFVRGIKVDGSVMEKEFWVKKGFERRIKRFEHPGAMEKISEARLSAIEKDIKGLPGTKRVLRREQRPSGVPAIAPDLPDRKVIKAGPREKREIIAEKREKATERMEKIMGRQERMEKTIERSDAIRERTKDNVLERRAYEDLRRRRLRRLRDDTAN